MRWGREVYLEWYQSRRRERYQKEKNRKHGVYSLDEMEEKGDCRGMPFCVRDGLEETALRNICRDKVREALGKLPEPDAELIELLYFKEVTVTDAEAEMMNKYIGETAKAAHKKANELEGAGTYTLDGPQAVTYSRLRKLEGGDYKRTERQREVIQKLFDKITTTDLSTINEIIDTVFPQVSTSFSLKKIIALASALMDYSLGESTGFPFEKTDGIKYPKAGDVVVAQGLAENVKELHEFLYPHKVTEEVSDTVQMISDEIAYETGVVRPAELDAQTEGESDEEGSDGTESSDGEEDDGTESSEYDEDYDRPYADTADAEFMEE